MSQYYCLSIRDISILIGKVESFFFSFLMSRQVNFSYDVQLIYLTDFNQLFNWSQIEEIIKYYFIAYFYRRGNSSFSYAKVVHDNNIHFIAFYNKR
jgi:hypothetical protein